MVTEDVGDNCMEMEREYSGEFEFVFRQSPVAMYIYNPENLALLDGNGAALKLYGYSEEEFRKLSVRDLIEKDFMESFEKIFLKRLSQLE
ncbi:MAG TPA: PAS domain S-box protein, partial [Sphingobacteriaceae bacterium]